MKIMFLDIDGVLNSVRSAMAYAGYPHSEMDCDKFDDVAIKLIKTICIKTDCYIILSSTWKNSVEPLMFGQKLGLPIIGKTPSKFSASRGEEIDMYLRDSDCIDKYVIVDDDSDMLKEQLPFFVKVNNRNGLSYENYEQIIKILQEVSNNAK